MFVGEDPVVVAFAGDLDLATCNEFEAKLAQASDAGARHLIVDLTEVPFMDSSGLACLLRARLRMEPDERILLRGAGPSVRRVLEVTNTAELFEFEASPE